MTTYTQLTAHQALKSFKQCATEYFVRVFIIAVSQRLSGLQLQNIHERVVVGGEENCVHEISFATT